MQEMSWDQYQQMCFAQQSMLPYPSYPTPMTTPLQSPDFPHNISYFPASTSQHPTFNHPEQKKGRRYKTPSPQVLRVRRTAANERERNRMNTLNVAYEELRTVLPEMDSGRRLSKFETLQMAQQYIECLAEILKNPQGKASK